MNASMKALVHFLRAEWKTFLGLLALVGVTLLFLDSSPTPQPTLLVAEANVVPGERLGAVTLKMTRAEVEGALGAPTSTATLPGGLEVLRYQGEGLEVAFEGVDVIAIRALINSDAPFDNVPELVASGALMESSPKTFGAPALPEKGLVRDHRALDKFLGAPLSQMSPVEGLSWQIYPGGLIAVLIRDKGSVRQGHKLRELIVLRPDATPPSR